MLFNTKIHERQKSPLRPFSWQDSKRYQIRFLDFLSRLANTYLKGHFLYILQPTLRILTLTNLLRNLRMTTTTTVRFSSSSLFSFQVNALDILEQNDSWFLQQMVLSASFKNQSQFVWREEGSNGKEKEIGRGMEEASRPKRERNPNWIWKKIISRNDCEHSDFGGELEGHFKIFQGLCGRSQTLMAEPFSFFVQ